MKKSVSVTLLLLAICSTLWAQDSRSASTNASGRSGAAPAAPTALQKHVLKGVYNSISISSATYGAGFTAVDGVTSVTCPPGTCFIHADLWIQLGGTTSSLRVALCFLIDGTDLQGCPFLGDTLANGHYSMYSFSKGYVVTTGTHTVQTVVYSPDGTVQSQAYNFNYGVYK
jgi:hypothetical protein